MKSSSHKYSRLSSFERGKIELLQDKGPTFIARELGRSKSSICEELSRGTYKGIYQAGVAKKRAERAKLLRRKHQRIEEPELMAFIETMLKKRWPPETIAHEWRGKPVSGMTIRNIIKKHRREWKKYLLYQKKAPYHKGSAGRSLIPYRTDISQRSPVRFGDWEADTVISARGSKVCLGVFAERTTRLYKVVKMPDRTADSMVRATLSALSGMSVNSITYDNGSENTDHWVTNMLLGCSSYFCRPYRSGDKGLVEHRNRDLRQYLPKGTKMDLISEAELSRIETEINERPMKCLGWRSPIQAFLSSPFG